MATKSCLRIICRKKGKENFSSCLNRYSYENFVEKLNKKQKQH